VSLTGSPLDALFLTLLEMAVGGLAALLLTDWRGEVTRGFLRLCAACVAPLGLLAWLVPGARPAPVGLLLALVVIGSLLYFLLLLRASPSTLRFPIALATCAVGVGLLGLLGVTAPPAEGGTALLVLAIVADTVVVGTSGVALVLGHWYLVTPRLSARPLRRLVDLLLVGLALEALVVALPLLVMTGPAVRETFSDVTTWGRLSALIVLPVITAVLARACCREWPRGRALQAATGLLYVVVGSALGGILLGNLLRFSAPTAL
jgi:hypothetical protein